MTPVTDYEGFLGWLKKGPERAPHLYGGKIVHKAVEGVKEPVLAPKEAPLEAPVDFKSAAAGEDWDGIEEEG